MKLIVCDNVCLSYDNTVVTENLSFCVGKGDFLCVVGENGSGKSTLVKAVLGLKSVTSGKIKFENEVGRKNIGYLPQQNASQKDFPASVYEVVLSGLLSSKKGLFFSRKQKDIALSNMKKLDILDLKNRSFRELSGGQQQRVLLARALCSAEKLLLLDEPVTGLDVAVTSEFYDIIEKLNKEYGVTIIMVSHDLLYAASHASHILHMKKNDSFFGTAKEYLESDIFRSFKGGKKDD